MSIRGGESKARRGVKLMTQVSRCVACSNSQFELGPVKGNEQGRSQGSEENNTVSRNGAFPSPVLQSACVRR